MEIRKNPGIDFPLPLSDLNPSVPSGKDCGVGVGVYPDVELETTFGVYRVDLLTTHTKETLFSIRVSPTLLGFIFLRATIWYYLIWLIYCPSLPHKDLVWTAHGGILRPGTVPYFIVGT